MIHSCRYSIETCCICGHKYNRAIGRRQHYRSKLNIRRLNCVTCSKACSRSYVARYRDKKQRKVSQ